MTLRIYWVVRMKYKRYRSLQVTEQCSMHDVDIIKNIHNFKSDIRFFSYVVFFSPYAHSVTEERNY